MPTPGGANTPFEDYLLNKAIEELPPYNAIA
jgi:hypothetical protein